MRPCLQPLTSRARGVAAAGLTAGLVAASCGSSGTSSDTQSPSEPATDCPADGDEWEVAKLYVEHNATDADTGVHGLFGGSAWSVLCLTDPTGATILVADPMANLDGLTVADLFFESREPPNDEYPIDELRRRFPTGEYTVAGVDFEGTARVGAAVFTHDIPAEPTITSPTLAEDAETAGDAPAPATGLVVEWAPVTETIDGAAVTITGYEVIITDEFADDPNGFARPIYDVHVPADQLSLPVPDEFLRPATVYELEVLAIEESGNQTISIGFFSTE